MDAPNLDDLRQQIDAIDDTLHDLLMRRAELVDRISASKPAGGLALRPGREAQVIRRLLQRHGGRFPPAAMVRLWREIMGAFTFLQCPIRVAICRPNDQPGFWDLARDHFGVQVPFTAHETPFQVLAAVRADPNVVGLVPAPAQDEPQPWWPRLMSGDPTTPNVVQKVPFVAMPNSRGRELSAFVLARLEAEPSGDDRALIAVEATEELSRSRLAAAIRKAGLQDATALFDVEQAGTYWDLIEIPEFVGDADPRLEALRGALGIENARVVALGAYAVPPLVR
ncbi:MAG: chorismate mutase [Alphaproteobacteria bacterium]|nr:chorismate mutase [Alphaproteobacteria bacterium]